MDVFESCRLINECLNSARESDARNKLIKLLDHMNHSGLTYGPLVNALIRQVGLFPYLDEESAGWGERYVAEVFKADVGGGETYTLHREQSRLLNALLAGRSIAVSAPTSFGKSFVIDAFISARRPSCVVILVPTIALADETRRRLQRKFGAQYRIITTSDARTTERNIFVFPQERALTYVDSLKSIDMLVVDEFYKASKSFDPERSPSLIRAIMQLSEKATQRYFLAPNVTALSDGPFTRDMEFLRLDFNTVYLDKRELYGQIGRDERKKGEALLDILKNNPGKTLIYAGNYANIERVSTLLLDSFAGQSGSLNESFSEWLGRHYDPNWSLPQLARRGVGIHNGRNHRSLSQIQVKLFEEQNDGISTLISTSSIIEGVNTSAENVVVWSNKNGRAKFNDFTYKNIIGRGGRMFRHFIGKIFILEEPPPEEVTQLELTYPDELLGTIDPDAFGVDLTPEQIKKLHAYEAEMQQLVGRTMAASFRDDIALQTSDGGVVLDIVKGVATKMESWRGLAFLNSNIPSQWDSLLYRLINLRPGYWDTKSRTLVEFVKVLHGNWTRSIPEMLSDLDNHNVGVNEFFQLERTVTFKLAAVLGDVEKIYNRLAPGQNVDLSLAIARFSNAFLPASVYLLEEYGLPRMISRAIHRAGLIDMEDAGSDIHDVVDKLRSIGMVKLVRSVGTLKDFDLYIVRYFFDGIESSTSAIG